MVLKGKIKNQTYKKRYTVIILNEYGEEIDNQTVEAESAREALCKLYSFLKN